MDRKQTSAYQGTVEEEHREAGVTKKELLGLWTCVLS